MTPCWLTVRTLLVVVVVLVLGLGFWSCAGPPSSSVGEGDRGQGGEALACNDRVQASLDAIEAVRVENLSCRRASDCTLFDPSTDCRGGCPLPVAVSGLELAQAAVTASNDGVCGNFTADGCPYATPDCLQLFADCVDGQCVATPSP